MSEQKQKVVVPQYNVEIVLPCKKHDQMKLDPLIITEESKRLVEDWLATHDCPAGSYRVSILRRMNPRKLHGKKFGHLHLDLKRNTVGAMINFGGQEFCRRVELIPPEGVKAELVHHLLAEKSAKVGYHSGSKLKIEAIYQMMLWALRRALISGEFSLLISGAHKIAGEWAEGGIYVIEYNLDYLLFVVRPEGEQPYQVRLCRREPTQIMAWVAMQMIANAGVVDLIANLSGSPKVKLEAMKKREDEIRAQVECTTKTCRWACFQMLGDDSFPEAPEKFAKQCYGRACHEYHERHNFSEFKEQWLDRVGHNCYCPKDHFFEWLAGNLQGDDNAIPDRVIEVAASIEMAVRNMTAETQQWQIKHEQDNKEAMRLAAEITDLESKLREATRQLQDLRERRRQEQAGSNRERLEAKLMAYQSLMDGAFGKLANDLEKKRKHRRTG